MSAWSAPRPLVKQPCYTHFSHWLIYFDYAGQELRSLLAVTKKRWFPI